MRECNNPPMLLIVGSEWFEEDERKTEIELIKRGVNHGTFLHIAHEEVCATLTSPSYPSDKYPRLTFPFLCLPSSRA